MCNAGACLQCSVHVATGNGTWIISKTLQLRYYNHARYWLRVSEWASEAMKTLLSLSHTLTHSLTHVLSLSQQVRQGREWRSGVRDRKVGMTEWLSEWMTHFLQLLYCIVLCCAATRPLGHSLARTLTSSLLFPPPSPTIPAWAAAITPSLFSLAPLRD
jgi:hypothetical protein